MAIASQYGVLPHNGNAATVGFVRREYESHTCARIKLCVLASTAHDYAVQIATQKIACGNCQPEGQYLGKVSQGKIHGYAEVKERIGYTVRETAVDENRYAEKHGQILAFTCKGDHGCHYETASYC